MINPFDLGRAESDVSGQVASLHHELEMLEATRQAIAEAEFQAASSGSSYGAQSVYGRPGGSYASDSARGLYGNDNPAGVTTLLQQAHAREAEILARIGAIASFLRTQSERTRSFRSEVQGNLGSMSGFRNKLHGREQKEQYRAGEAKLGQDLETCNRILSTIDGALRHAASAQSGGVGMAARQGTSGLDAMLRGGLATAGDRAREGYVANTLQSATIYMLDMGRYGRFDDGAEVPRPDLGGQEHTRSGSLSDKVELGGGYVRWPLRDHYSVDLPDFYGHLRQRGYPQGECVGRYALVD